MNWLSLVSGVVKLFNLLTGWMRDTQLKQEGAQLEKGEQDAKTLEAIAKGQAARDSANVPGPARDLLDGELDVDRVLNDNSKGGTKPG